MSEGWIQLQPYSRSIDEFRVLCMTTWQESMLDAHEMSIRRSSEGVCAFSDLSGDPGLSHLVKVVPDFTPFNRSFTWFYHITDLSDELQSSDTYDVPHCNFLQGFSLYSNRLNDLVEQIFSSRSSSVGTHRFGLMSFYLILFHNICVQVLHHTRHNSVDGLPGKKKPLEKLSATWNT